MNALPEWFDWADVEGNDQPPPPKTLDQHLAEVVEERIDRDRRTCTGCGADFILDPFKGRKRTKCYVCSPPQLEAKPQGRPRKNASVVDNLPFRGHQIGEATPKQTDEEPPRSTKKPDEETVLDWWTAFDKGDTPAYIADVWHVEVDVVTAALDELGVLFEQRHPVIPTRLDARGRTVRQQDPSQSKSDEIELDEDILYRARHNQLDAAERKIMAALGIIAGSTALTLDDLPPRQPTPSVYDGSRKRHTRSHVPMSRRERKQNEMASGRWRRLVAQDMRRLGILPRRGR